MMRQYQQGIATLLITSILLSVALVVTLGSYKNLFYQIKRAQNEVKARQQHWEAEGGLECLFSYIKDDPSRIVGVIPVNHSNLDTLCKNTLNLSQINITDLTGGVYRINSISHNGWTQLNKTFSTLSNRGKGAIQTTSKLTTYGDLKVHPDAKGGLNSDGLYECVSMTYRYSYTMEGRNPVSKYKTESIRENSLYEGSPAGGCTVSTTTNVSVNSGNSITKTDNPETSDSSLKDDFVYDPEVDPFQTFFDYKKTPENIAKVKASFPVSGRITLSDATQCKSAIENAFSTVDKVWITGNCAIHGNLALQGNHEKYTLVIQDGIFINTGSTTFQGSIFHLVDKTKPQFLPDNLKSYWESLFTTSSGGPTNFTIGQQYTDLTQTVYVDAGAFHATGGYGFDTDGLKTSIAGSMELLFDSRKRPTLGLNSVRWQEGSWNAQ
ncbi:hypothetical protein O1D18_002685 [Vibrio cholerae]|nr:hypothetical protein [Vibrio cholerae]HCJ6811951.1 hypothetical protein [Vibrio cholerae]HCJ7283930.1 hypothetical protein [Vibrio cholerae]HCJ7314242.1 hypothetical protein [Vibrio cholerae]HCJ7321781.1 hypothetical protein [Vibrio cholerae]